MSATYRPRPAVKITLTLAMQNKILPALSSACGISESYPQTQIIYMNASTFAKLIADCAKLVEAPAIKHLKPEYVDLKQEPQVVTIMHREPYVPTPFEFRS